MPRSTAPWCITLAVFGRCSLIWSPGMDVAIGLNSPPSFVPGFMSKVSLCDGPPSIHRRMHDLCFALVWAACVARTLSQPDIEVAATPAADSLNRSRRDRLFRLVMVLSPFRDRIAPASGGREPPRSVLGGDSRPPLAGGVG